MSDPSRPPRFFPHVSDPPAAGLADLDEARELMAQLDPAWFEEENDPHAWLFEPAVQQLIAQVVGEAVDPWAGRLAPEDLRVLRDEIEMACHTDPTFIEHIDRIRPRAHHKRSGKTRKGMFQKGNGGVVALADAIARKKAGGGQP